MQAGEVQHILNLTRFIKVHIYVLCKECTKQVHNAHASEDIIYRWRVKGQKIYTGEIFQIYN